MTYLGIVLVILVLIAPIWALLPSARQKEQMALRKRAREAGLRTELTTIQDPDPDTDEYTSITGKPLEQKLQCIAYRVPRPRPSDWRSLPAMTWTVVRGPGGWQWTQPFPEAASAELRQAVDSALEKLPHDAIRVDEERYVVSIYWHERGGEPGVDVIIEALKSISSTMAHTPRKSDDDESDADDDD